uniref:Uncharacterized protein n=1 Tax=Rhizophora mucronata TaxID=61149 RepID=A0A2P2P6N1_RHIMU
MVYPLSILDSFMFIYVAGDQSLTGYVSEFHFGC